MVSSVIHTPHLRERPFQFTPGDVKVARMLALAFVPEASFGPEVRLPAGCTKSGSNLCSLYASWCCDSGFSLAPLGERGDRKAVGEGVRTSTSARRSVNRKRKGFDPLTRLAPADEIAGGETPSPPWGRGLVSLTPETVSQNDGLMLSMRKMRVRNRASYRTP